MLAELDAQITSILSELQTKQGSAFTKNRKYAQLLRSHDSVPDGVSEDVKSGAAMVRDEDILPTLPAKLPFAFRVDEYVSSEGEGWVLGVWAIEEGVTYRKWYAYGPEAALYPTEWTSTWDEATQKYEGP